MRTNLLPLAAILVALACAAQTNQSSLPQISLTSPVNYQVVQRSSRTMGKLIVSGVVLPAGKDGSPPDKLEARLIGKSDFAVLTGQWEPLPLDERAARFRGELAVPAGGWYRLEVRASRQGKTIAAIAVEHVGVGEVFVIAGQSNAANYGEQPQTNQTGRVSAFDGVSWRLAGDPEPGAGGKGGSFMPALGDALAGRFHVPIGLVAQGIGSTSVREWLPSGIIFTNLPTITRNVVRVGLGEWESTGRIFTNFTARLKELGPAGFRAVLWHQGESDANQAGIGRTLPGLLYRQYLEKLIRATSREIGWDAPWFVAQASYHGPDDLGSPDLRAGQKALWEAGVALEGPDTDALTGPMREKNGTGVHLSAAGLSAHAKLWAEKVAPWLNAQLDRSSR